MADWWLQSGTTSTETGANAPVIPSNLGVLTHRSIVISVGSTMGSSFFSTALALWTAPTRSVIESIKLAPLTPWSLTSTADMIQFWSCSAGVISTYYAATTGAMKTAGLVNSCFALNSTAASLAACESVRVGVSYNVCSCCGGAAFQFDYVTS